MQLTIIALVLALVHADRKSDQTVAPAVCFVFCEEVLEAAGGRGCDGKLCVNMNVLCLIGGMPWGELRRRGEGSHTKQGSTVYRLVGLLVVLVLSAVAVGRRGSRTIRWYVLYCMCEVKGIFAKDAVG